MMKKVFGIALIVVAVLAAVLLYRYVAKRKLYQDDKAELLIDSIEVIAIFGAVVFLGILFITEQ